MTKLRIVFPRVASTKFQLSITHPDFGQHGVEDLFRSLGPVAIFSAKRHWTAPRLIQLQRGPDGEGFGFSVRGDAPVIIAAVDHNSLADVRINTGLARNIYTCYNERFCFFSWVA